ncbi:MAG TPA: hypothetical protein PKY59_26645, partial [Pyrinomonadaceae bacterium]|nr:hypothetical protein [Pyrinomonadaceae bacterium]
AWFILFSVNSQTKAFQAKIAPFAIDKTDLVAELKDVKTKNPKISVQDFAKTANSLLETKGLNFKVGFDAGTCQKIEQVKKAQKDQSAPLNLKTTLKSPLGEAASLILPDPVFADSECFACSVTIPMQEITAQEFVTMVRGNNLKFYLPSNFLLSEVFLVDEKDLSTVQKKWRIPFKTQPLALSFDARVLYVGFDEPELSDLTLAIFVEGTFQFYPKSDLKTERKGTLLKDKNVPNFGFIKFSDGKSNHVLKFPTKCQN